MDFLKYQSPSPGQEFLPFGQDPACAPGLLALLSCTNYALPKKSMRDTLVGRAYHSAMQSTKKHGKTFRWQQ